MYKGFETLSQLSYLIKGTFGRAADRTFPVVGKLFKRSPLLVLVIFITAYAAFPHTYPPPFFCHRLTQTIKYELNKENN